MSDISMIDMEHFCTEVKRRPVLWDPNHEFYNQRHTKLAAWEEVGATMYVDWADFSNYDKFGKVRDIQNKWKNVRDIYMRELKYEKKVQKGMALPKRKYKYSHLLEFLNPGERTKDKAKPAKKHVPSKENVGIQATPQGILNQASSMNLATLSFLDNPESMLIKGPKTPPPLPKTKILEAADHLLAAAERELNLVEAKISSDRLLSAKTSSLHANELSSARRAMADLPLSPTKGIVCSHSLLNNRSKTSYCVPPNSLSSFKVNGGEDNYKRNNGEKKSLNNKHSSKPKESKPSKGKGEENLSQVEPRDTCNPSAIAGFSMFYEQQQLVEKKTQGFKEKNLATVIFKSDAKVVSSTAVVRQDAQTNTSPVSQNVHSNTFAQNSSIISMKTNKPEEEDLPKMFSGKALNVQKMPSVNIRPGFTIQHGPKINIVGTSTSSLKPKRKNTEFFDVVYPPSSPLFSDSSFLSEQGRPNKQMDNNVEYICERHTFPSGRLIPGTMGENLRQSHLRNSLNLNEKKEIVIDLIKSVTEKVEKQSSLGYKNCCRLVCSLPLLACVVRKIQVDCVKCVDLLNNHLNRLEVLMKEELRGNREMSDEHCCQLDEAIHYQIVELELMEEENLKSQPPAPVTVVRHRENETSAKATKKSVSFESIPDELAGQIDAESRKHLRRNNISQSSSNKITSASFGKGSKISFGPQQATTSKATQDSHRNNMSRKIALTEQKQVLSSVKKANNRESQLNPILKKSKDALSKEKTVVGQVLTNLTYKKSILKHETVPKDSRSANVDNKSKVLNAYVKVVDHKDSTSEFEKWIEERSVKIRQIHDELNKMVAGSMESYLETHPLRNENMATTSRLKLLDPPNRKINDERQCLEPTEDVRVKRNHSPQEQTEDQESNDNNKLDLSSQDDAQGYDEDFEEDVDELLNASSLDSNLQRTNADAKNSSSASSDIDEAVTDGGTGMEETSVTAHKLTNDVSNMTLGENESLKQPVAVEKVEGTPDIHILLDNFKISNSDNEAMPAKIDMATSPINFQTRSQKADACVNTSIAQVEAKTVTMATSPINLKEGSLSHLKSLMVQTVNLGDSEINSATSNRTNEDEVDLTVPSVRLTPKPIENILQITLGETKENSLAIHTDSSNQSLKLIVQLPGPDKYKERKNITELECSDESARESHSRVTKTANERNSNTKSLQGEGKFHDTSVKEKIDEQTIKSIIEPTVSEILKKINEDNVSMNNPSQNEGTNNPISYSNTLPGLVKPNVILQTKHGVWKGRNDNPVPSNDLELANPKVDSSMQTDTEKQNASVQAVDSPAASGCEKATTAQGYLEMLLPPPPQSVLSTAASSRSPSSTCHSSSRSSSTSTSSKRKYEKLIQLEKLSDGELLPESCDCKIGEVCEVCVPRLDLSFGELKTKKKGSRPESVSSSDSNFRQTSVSLSNLPLHLEPRPNYARTTPLSAPNLTRTPNPNLKSASSRSTKPLEAYRAQTTGSQKEAAAKKEWKPSLKQFSDVAQSVLDDLGKELSTLDGSAHAKYLFPKPPLSITTIDLSSGKNLMDTSSSDSLKSSSQKSLRSKKNGTKQKSSLVIKKPLETPRIDAVIEDPELSTSSYQTSITSVSVDQLPEVLSSHSSADASS